MNIETANIGGLAMNALSLDHELTMSSQEIAKITGSRHDNVKRTMERLAEVGVVRFTPSEETSHKDTAKTQYPYKTRSWNIRLFGACIRLRGMGGGELAVA